MAIPQSSFDRPGAVHCSQDVASSAESAFALMCEVEKWPVWLSFLRSARRLNSFKMLGLGDEVAIRSAIPGGEEELFEVDQYIENHIVSLVGAYSVRRRIDLRVERKTERSKIVVRIDYPTYGGAIGRLIDRITVRRKLEGALGESLVHFKGLCEYNRGPDALLEDF